MAKTDQSFRTKIGRIDFLGSATLVSTVSCLLVSLTLKTSGDSELAWSDPIVWGLLVASAVFGIAFILVEKYVANEPIMPLRLVTQRTPAFVAISNFLISVLAFSVLYNVPLWFSAVKRVSSSVSGSHLVPNSIALAAGSVAAGAWMRHTGKYYWLTVSMAGSAFLSMIVISTFTTKTPEWVLWLAIVPSGFGISGLVTSTLIALIAVVRKEDIAVATGVSYMFRTTGQVLGVSLSAALTQSVLTKKLSQGIKGHHASEIITKIRHSTAYIDHLSPQNKEVAIASYTAALRIVFICQIVVAGLALLSVAGITEVDLPDRAKPKPVNEEEEV
ncbi:hypothetical protein QFC24_000900 [Naganishia onofrii]|uniref:Uncharacterized protein n=1 Tax=Naganishia onofrii TaxID=1851511 RepID=A0ACC2XV34_9TREE|nr:hypothetical protein QFC24_000900 [Naganishia onofrii]